MEELRLEPPEPEDADPFRVELRVQVGDQIKAGDCVAVIENDMTATELEAPDSFTVKTIRKTSRGYILQIEKT